MSGFHSRYAGFSVRSSRPLAGLPPAPAQPPDIEIEILDPGRRSHGELPWVMPAPPRPLWRAESDAGSFLRLRYQRGDEWAEFVIDPVGARAWVSRSESVAESEATELMLGPVFSCLLGQRGMTCIHAAAVRVDARVVALVGPSGAGKSTAATALLHEGAQLVCDDVAVLSLSGSCERPAVLPGAPRLRLAPDTAHALAGSFEALTPMWVHEARRPAKRYLAVADEDWIADDEPATLDRLYFLGPSDDAGSGPTLERLTPGTALAGLMANRHMSVALGRGGHQRDFATLAGVADAVPARRLSRPATMGSMNELTALIRADAGQPA